MSERAFAATVYISPAGLTCRQAHLIMVKIKVEPVKTVSVPRLKFCSSVFTAKLVDNVRGSLNL